MSLTLGLTGMDPATETALKAAFTDANAKLSGRWQLLPETTAEHVMVDMDSMYGPMSWLRLHAAGKRVIGLTTAARTQTDFRLGRPFDSDSVAALLRGIAEAHDTEPTTVQAPATPDQAAASAPAAIGAPAAATADNADTRQADAANDESPVDTPKPAAVTAPAPSDDAPVAPSELRLGDWLAPGALSGRVRYRAAGGHSLLIDPAARAYHGPGTLKPLAASFEGSVRREDFESVDDAAWEREAAAAGPAQPLQRLQWLAALVAGQGALLPSYDPQARYRLNKWPQTEREYPRHFRIATAMMKGPATLAEIADGSGMPAADVADFVNANLATGYAELVPEAPAEPAEAPKTGLFGRLRGR